MIQQVDNLRRVDHQRVRNATLASLNEIQSPDISKKTGWWFGT
jgi:hypothetical protein